MSEELSTTELFTHVGLGTKILVNTHIRFNDDGGGTETDESYTKTIDEIISSTPQSPDANENEPTTSSEEKTQFVELPDKFLEFLDRIAPKDFSFGEKLNFLMKTYDQNNANKNEEKILPFNQHHQIATNISVQTKPTYELDSFRETFNGEPILGRENSLTNGVENRRKLNCFNCNGDHSIAECKEERNEAMVRKNKEIHRLQKQRTQDSPKRYAEEACRKYSHIKPGTVSESLRNALGLTPNQLPPWVYQMRVLGYPPGHLMEALNEPSNLQMFDDNNIPTNPAKKSKLSMYDPNRLIEYPGFNVPPPPNAFDEYAVYNMPPMMPHQQKEAFLHFLNSAGAFGSEEVVNEEKKVTEKSVEEMDLSDDAFPPPLPPPPPPPPPENVSRENSRTLSSPTMSDLESQRQLLLDQLRLTSSQSSVSLDNESSKQETSDSSSLTSPTTEPLNLSNLELSASTTVVVSRKWHSAESIAVEVGTPTAMVNSATKPSLESFRHSVNAFETKEETLPCQGGGMKKIKEILSKRKRK